VEVGAHYQINHGQDGWPYFIGNLRYKSNTGKGPFEVPTIAMARSLNCHRLGILGLAA